jgi:O-antigen/teichoic acid export membrane protein
MSESPPPPGPDTSSVGAAAPRPSHGRAFLVRAVLTYGTSGSMALLQLVNVLVVSRVLGASGRGGVAFLITVAVLSAQLGSLSVQQANSNIGGAEPATRRSLATNSVFFAGGLGLLAIAAVVLLIALVPAAGAGSGGVARVLALASIPPLMLGDYLASLLTSNYRFGVTNVAALLGPALTLTANGILAATGHLGVASAVGAWAGGQLVATLVITGAVVRGEGFGAADAALGRRMATFGLKTHGGRVLNFGNYRLDQWLVGSIAGTRELGLYSVAVAWSEGLFLLPNAVAGVQRPDLVRSDPETARHRALRAHAIVQGVTLVLVVALIALAHPLCVGVFGKDFAESTDQLRVLACGAFGVVALKQLGDALIAQRHPLLESAVVAVAFVCTMTLDVLLIPSHGGLGASIASTVAYTVAGAGALLLFLRTIAASGRPSERSRTAVG